MIAQTKGATYTRVTRKITQPLGRLFQGGFLDKWGQ